MGPETATQVTPANLEMTRAQVELRTGNFARAYARGGNMLAWLRDKVTGRPDEATEAARDLHTSVLRLAEYEGRSAAENPGVGVLITTRNFRTDLARAAAESYQESQDEAIVAATEAVQTPGMWTGVSRIWHGPDGDFARVAVTGVATAAYFIGGPVNADAWAHVAVASGAITAMDLGRRLILDGSTRLADLPARTAELIRRKASVNQGQIDGENENPEVGELISADLQDRQDDALHTALVAHDIQMPPIAAFDEPWTTGVRNVVEGALRPFDQLQETIRSRDIAVRSRLMRTVIAAGIVLGTYAHFINTRPEQLSVEGKSCPVISFPDLNQRAQDQVGTDRIAHLTGIGLETVFFNAQDTHYDHSAKHEELLNKLMDQDREGMNAIVAEIANELRKRNPQLTMVTPDAFRIRDKDGKAVKIVGICDADEQKEIYNRAIDEVAKKRHNNPIK